MGCVEWWKEGRGEVIGLIITLDKKAWENITDKRKASLSKWGQKVFYYQINLYPIILFLILCLQDVYSKKITWLSIKKDKPSKLAH